MFELSRLECRNITLTRITPPVDFEPTILHSEENEDHAHSDASVKCSRENVVISHPPSEVEAADAVVEDEADDRPGYIVDSAAGGNGTNTSEENWDVDVSPERQGEATSKEVEWNGGNSTNSEEPQEVSVPSGSAS
jgi:hypothetical protein